MIKTVRLDSILKQNGWVTDEQIRQGLMHQERHGGRWGSALVELGVISETVLAKALCEQYTTPLWDPLTFTPDPAAMGLFRESWQRRNGILPLSYDAETKSLHVAMTDPCDPDLAEEVRANASIETLTISAAPAVSLERIWNQFFGPPSSESAQRLGETSLRSETTVAPKGQDFPSQSAQLGKPEIVTPTIDPESLLNSGKHLLGEFWESAEARPTSRVLLWLARRHMADQIEALLQSENCVVAKWDGKNTPNEDWDYLIYDSDNAESNPERLTQLKREMPWIQLIRRTSFTGTLLKTPISYNRMRDGYLQLAQLASLWVCDDGEGSDASRYALAVAQHLSLTPIEVDTLAVACSLEPVLCRLAPTNPEREALLSQIECPYPVAEALTPQGTSSVEHSPVGKIFKVVMAFMQERRSHQITTIEEAAQFNEWLRNGSGRHYDAAAVDALLRVVREEILESYLPPGPSEVIMVADHSVAWHSLPSMLEAEGWRVVVAGNASETRSLVGRRCPDAVIWAASGALEWIRWQSRSAPGVASFLLMEDFEPGLARAAVLAGFEDVWSGEWDAGVASAKLRRAVERRPHPPTHAQAVTGTLSQMSFIDMVQILASGSRSVKIDFSKGKHTGRVIVWQGQIKFAEAGHFTGDEAVYEILTWHDATFCLSPVDSVPEPNCLLANEALLLEGCRRMDEHSRADAAPAAASQIECAG